MSRFEFTLLSLWFLHSWSGAQAFADPNVRERVYCESYSTADSLNGVICDGVINDLDRIASQSLLPAKPGPEPFIPQSYLDPEAARVCNEIADGLSERSKLIECIEKIRGKKYSASCLKSYASRPGARNPESLAAGLRWCVDRDLVDELKHGKRVLAPEASPVSRAATKSLSKAPPSASSQDTDEHPWWDKPEIDSPVVRIIRESGSGQSAR